MCIKKYIWVCKYEVQVLYPHLSGVTIASSLVNIQYIAFCLHISTYFAFKKCEYSIPTLVQLTISLTSIFC